MIYLLVRNIPQHYPFNEICTGLAGANLEFTSEYPSKRRTDYQGDWVITWNDYGYTGRIADHVRAHGGQHISIENGYTNLFRGEKVFAVSYGKHHFIDKKFVEVSLEFKRTKAQFFVATLPTCETRINDGPILIALQRGGGYSSHAMPDNWPVQIVDELRTITNAELWMRPHPHKQTIKIPFGAKEVSAKNSLVGLLQHVSRVVVYTSNASTEAIIYGIPTYFMGPRIPLLSLGQSGLSQFNSPRLHTIDYIETQIIPLVQSEFTRSELAQAETWRNILK